jgi:hypothetical protein
VSSSLVILITLRLFTIWAGEIADIVWCKCRMFTTPMLRRPQCSDWNATMSS